MQVLQLQHAVAPQTVRLIPPVRAAQLHRIPHDDGPGFRCVRRPRARSVSRNGVRYANGDADSLPRMFAAAGSPLRRSAMALVATGAAFAIARGARAETARGITARLDYAADPACPDEAALRSAVAQRLGTDPFRDDARATVRARIARTERGFSADVAFDDPAGRHGERRLASEGDDCRELATTVALTVAIMVDPRTFGGAAPPASASASPSPSPRVAPLAE